MTQPVVCTFTHTHPSPPPRPHCGPMLANNPVVMQWCQWGVRCIVQLGKGCSAMDASLRLRREEVHDMLASYTSNTNFSDVTGNRPLCVAGSAPHCGGPCPYDSAPLLHWWHDALLGTLFLYWVSWQDKDAHWTTGTLIKSYIFLWDFVTLWKKMVLLYVELRIARAVFLSLLFFSPSDK